MQILQVNKFYHPVIGGIERVVRHLAEGLQARDYDVRVLTARRQGVGKHERVNGVPVARTSSLGTALSTPLSPTFPSRLAQTASEADIVHHHLPNPLSVISHQLTAPDAPTVVTYHSDIVRQETALKLYRPVLERFLNSVDHIITTSPHLRDNSPFLEPHSDKTTVIPLSIDLDEYADVTSGESEPPILTDRPVVLFVGRLNYYKGVEYLLEAIAELDADATLLLVGDGERRTDLEQRVDELDVGDRVTFLGTVDDEKLQRCYASADVFVLPSVEPSEAFGLVQLEAMAHEIPVINTSLPTGVPWVSLDGETGLTVPPEDADALANALDQLLSNSSLRREYGKNGRTRVESRFSRKRALEDTISVYESL